MEKPLSKSRATPNPVNTPPKAADCSNTKHELERRVVAAVVEARHVRDLGEPSGERDEEEEREHERRDEQRRGA